MSKYLKGDIHFLLNNLIKQADENKPWQDATIYNNHLRDLKEYITYLEGNQQQEWLPIALANPEDTILGYYPEGQLEDSPMQVMRMSHGMWSDAVYHEWHAEPTHFLPLPKPPRV